jgi:hypothetical protein
MTMNPVSVKPVSARVSDVVELRLETPLDEPIVTGARCWVLIDVRQDAGVWQSEDEDRDNYVSAHRENADGVRSKYDLTCEKIRTLDLYPRVPEFLTMCEINFRVEDSEASSDILGICVTNWHAPERPITSFRFWIVFDLDGTLDFASTGYKTYRRFIRRGASSHCAIKAAETFDAAAAVKAAETVESAPAIDYDALISRMREGTIRVDGAYAPIPRINTRSTPGIVWGELHGMAFNQRPIDDFYNYAKTHTRLDFCAAVLFSYNTCVGDVWDDVKVAAERHFEPESFVPIVAFECGTPDDDSHRVAYFFDPRNVPPIFCETRPPALDATLTGRFHPKTIVCETLDAYYRAVHRYGGFVAGHFHTRTYRKEILAELWQKQEFGAQYQLGKKHADEEENLYAYLRNGLKMGFTGGSDTHDSMPGNPYPEPGCPRAAGFTGVHLDELTPIALEKAIRSRRTIATSGARIGIWVNYGDYSIGDIAQFQKDNVFDIRVDAASAIDTVEVLHDGRPVHVLDAVGSTAEFEYRPHRSEAEESFYHVRVRQRDGHVAWSSPIWIETE